MKTSDFKSKLPRSILRAAAPLCALLLCGTVASAHDSSRDFGRPPRVPAALQVGNTNVLQFHVTGIGVQIYAWTPSATDPAQFSWVLKAPHAVLVHDDDDLVGIHFGGPTWQGNDGSKVVGQRVASLVVDNQAIPWLLLRAASNDGTGIFSATTFIQRLNTEGGLAPSTPGTFAGQEVLVPYQAEYYFYRAK